MSPTKTTLKLLHGIGMSLAIKQPTFMRFATIGNTLLDIYSNNINNKVKPVSNLGYCLLGLCHSKYYKKQKKTFIIIFITGLLIELSD